MKYGKLVRDRIPEIINKKGMHPIIHIASEDEYIQKLNAKLKEEVDEFLKDSNKEELADIMEVINAIMKLQGIEIAELEKVRQKKRDERGGFDRRIILDETK